MRRRLVLHLGLWKTGTKTIQYFLRENPELLAELGVYYPRVGPDNPHHPFLFPKPDADFLAREISHQFLGQELTGRKRGSAVDLPLWSTAFRLINGNEAHTAIISYETFSAQVHAYDFDAIAERLKTFDVVGVIYLRPQEPWAVSLYSHEVRGARTSLPFGRFVDSIRPRLTYSALLDHIQSRIPLNSLIVRNFDDASRTGLIEDFFECLDLPRVRSTPALSYAVKNTSLPSWAVLFMLKCVQASLPGDHIMDIRKALTWRAAHQRSVQLVPGLDLASPAERTELRAMMSADAGPLEEKYGIALAELAPKLEPGPYRPFDNDDFNAIKDAIASKLAIETRAALDKL